MLAQKLLFFCITTGNANVIDKSKVEGLVPGCDKAKKILENLQTGQFFYVGPFIIVGVTEQLQ